MDGEWYLTMVLGIVCILVLVIILIRLFVCPERVFQTKKSYEKECKEYEERRKKMNSDHPTLVSRLSWFFELPEDLVREELRSVCRDESESKT